MDPGERTTGESLSCPTAATTARSPAPSPLAGVWEMSYPLAEAAAWSGSDPAGDCHIRAGDEFVWTFDIKGDALTVAWFDPTASDFPANYTVKSWHRAGDAAATVSSTR
jgi:hypothetical protein